MSVCLYVCIVRMHEYVCIWMCVSGWMYCECTPVSLYVCISIYMYGRGNGDMLVLIGLYAAFDTNDYDTLFCILEKCV